LSGAARVVIVHDYLTQRGGAERVVLALLKAFPEAVVRTSFYDPAGTFPEFAQYDVRPTRLNAVRFFRTEPRRAFPMLQLLFRFMRIPAADLVICSSSGFSHHIRSRSPVLIYCHNPPRWLYQTDDYFAASPRLIRRVARRFSRLLSPSDRASALRASMYIANSTSVAKRLKTHYDIDAAVVFPPSALDSAGPKTAISGIEPGYFLTVSRGRSYKQAEQIVAAFEAMPERRLLVVGKVPGRVGGTMPSNISTLSGLTDAEMRWAYSNAAALVAVSHEDFGLTPVESYSFGKPAAVLNAGGYLDSSSPATTVFIEEATATGVIRAVRRLADRKWNHLDIEQHARRFDLRSFIQQMQSIAGRVIDAG
jgi:glycosyltransferase involved in cell wall biosynthesis